MLFRGNFFRELGGFDPQFFLYFEDFDLSLRSAAQQRTAYSSKMRIRHAGGNTARKGWRHVLMFTKSGYRFFSKHGWKLL